MKIGELASSTGVAARDAGLSLAAIQELFQPGPVEEHWKRIVSEPSSTNSNSEPS